MSEHLRWSIKPESLRAIGSGTEITLGIAYGPVPDTETMVCPVEEMILVRAEAASLRRDNERLRAEATDAANVRESAQEMLLMARSFLEVCNEGGGDNPVTRRQAYFELSSACGWMSTALASRETEQPE